MRRTIEHQQQISIALDNSAEEENQIISLNLSSDLRENEVDVRHCDRSYLASQSQAN